MSPNFHLIYSATKLQSKRMKQQTDLETRYFSCTMKLYQAVYERENQHPPLARPHVQSHEHNKTISVGISYSTRQRTNSCCSHFWPTGLPCFGNSSHPGVRNWGSCFNIQLETRPLCSQPKHFISNFGLLKLRDTVVAFCFWVCTTPHLSTFVSIQIPQRTQLFVESLKETGLSNSNFKSYWSTRTRYTIT